MKNNPIFSIIIPAYNAENYIFDTFQSINFQTYKDFEIIIVDDASNDSTVNTVLEIIRNYPDVPIKLLKNENNLRQGASRNKAIDASTGEYLVFLDSDDKLFDNKVLENLNNTICSNNYPDIIYTGLKAEGIRNFDIIPTKENCDKKYRLSEYKWSNVTTICWRSSLIKENNIKFPEGIYYEDVYFNFLGICKSSTYAIGDFISYLYCTRPTSSMGFKQFSQVKDTISLIEHLATLKDKIPEEYIECLYNRIEQQKSRIIPRLDKILDSLELKSNTKK